MLVGPYRTQWLQVVTSWHCQEEFSSSVKGNSIGRRASTLTTERVTGEGAAVVNYTREVWRGRAGPVRDRDANGDQPRFGHYEGNCGRE